MVNSVLRRSCPLCTSKGSLLPYGISKKVSYLAFLAREMSSPETGSTIDSFTHHKHPMYTYVYGETPKWEPGRVNPWTSGPAYVGSVYLRESSSPRRSPERKGSRGILAFEDHNQRAKSVVTATSSIL